MDGEELTCHCLGQNENPSSLDFHISSDAKKLSAEGALLIKFFPRFLSSDTVESLLSFYNVKRELGQFQLDTVQCRGRQLLFNDSYAITLMKKLEPILAQILGIRLGCSYSLFSFYPAGCVLKRHTDRIECGWTISILLDARNEKAEIESEQLGFECDESDVLVNRSAGDAVLFNGVKTAHWRTDAVKCASYTTLLLHFQPQTP